MLTVAKEASRLSLIHIYIEQLRNLVDVPAPQPAADPGQARIVARRLPAAVVETAHGAKLDDAERLLVEAVAALYEKDRPPAVELDQDGDEHEQRRRQKQRRRRQSEIEHPLLDDLEARQRATRDLQAGDRSERREFDFVELVQDLLRAEVNLDRKRKEGLGAAFDGFGRRPGQQHEDGCLLYTSRCV